MFDVLQGLQANMRLNSSAGETAIRRMESCLRIVAFVSLGLLGRAADSEAQSPGQVRLSLLEASAGAESRSCTLEVLVNEDNRGSVPFVRTERATRLPPRGTSRLDDVRGGTPYTLASAARVVATAELREARARGVPAVAKGTMTIEGGNQRVVLDASQGPETLSGNDQQTLRLLREIADESAGGRTASVYGAKERWRVVHVDNEHAGIAV